jgi:hypothetical protein
LLSSIVQQTAIILGMHPQTILPSEYSQPKLLDLANRRAIIIQNLLAIPLVAAFYGIFLRIMPILHPGGGISHSSIPQTINLNFWYILGILFGFLILIVIHELIHGFFFWLFTKERPTFAFKGAYAYAAAPGWYFPRNTYLLIGLAPFVFLTTGLLVLSFFLTSQVAYGVLMIAAIHAAASLGDIVVVGWTLFFPSSSLVQDQGDRFLLFLREATV